MKCIKINGVIQRVSDDQALLLINRGGVYCPKSEWKNQGNRSSKVLSESKETPVNSKVKKTNRKQKAKRISE